MSVTCAFAASSPASTVRPNAKVSLHTPSRPSSRVARRAASQRSMCPFRAARIITSSLVPTNTSANADHSRASADPLSASASPPEAAGVSSPAPASQPAGGPSAASVAPSSTSQGGAARSKDSVPDVHDSWRVYEKPGNLCVICEGTGKNKCLYCFGDGVVYVGAGGERDKEPCPQCKGMCEETCPRCKGSGIRPSTRIDLETMQVVPNRTNQDVINDHFPDGCGVAPWHPKIPDDLVLGDEDYDDDQVVVEEDKDGADGDSRVGSNDQSSGSIGGGDGEVRAAVGTVSVSDAADGHGR